MNSSLARLDAASLRSLAAAFRSGPLVHGFSRATLARLIGRSADEAEASIRQFVAAGFSPAQMALLLDELAEAAAARQSDEAAVRLVLSGPSVEGIPTGDTAAVFRALVEEAEAELLLVGYAVHQGRKLFERVAGRMADRPELRVSFCLDISRGPNDTSLDSEVVRRFAAEFRQKHWPWSPLPEVWHDPRALDPDRAKRAVLHAKCVIVDRRAALVSSANFTEAAQTRNIEAGVVLRDAEIARRLAGYFEGLQRDGVLERVGWGG